MFLPSGHRHGKKSKKDRDHRPKEPGTKQEKVSSLPTFSFLFVVNELEIIEEGNGEAPNVDRWGNPLPPNLSTGYGAEKVGRVWRYSNGVISPADGYSWYREEVGLEGNICGPFENVTEDGQPFWDTGPLEAYSTYSVFNCWRFLPCLYTDDDVSTVPEMNVDNHWFTLEFSRDANEPGTTRIDGCGGSRRNVVGSKPAWIPGVLPATYSAPSSAPRSTGLGGCLPIILGLLALTTKPGHTDDVFANGLLERHRWRGERHSKADPPATGPVRGVMVQVCCDTYNSYGSTMEAIEDFEQHGKFILE